MTAGLPVLYSFRRCPYAIRARMALLRAGLAVELREVALGNKPAALLAVSPKATVPVLQDTDGRVIDESLAIMRWALRHNDPAGWLPCGDTPHGLALLEANDGPFKQALDRYKYADRHPGRSRAEYRAEAEAALLLQLEQALGAAPFLCGGQAGLVDVAVFPFVRQFAGVEPAWFSASPWVGVRRWLRYWLESPHFTATMGKWPPWTAQQPPVRWGPG